MLADNFFVSPDDGLSADKLSAALQVIRAHHPAPDNQIFVPLTNAAVPDIMARNGCEDKGPTYLMERPLTEADSALTPTVTVYQVKSVQGLERYNRIPGGNIALNADVHRREFRFYYVLDGQIPVAQGRSWRCRPSISWESHVYTNPNFQRRGFATALMQRIIRDNAQTGIQHSVLLASEAGHRLYGRIGYTDRLTIGCYRMKTKD
jgi:GNAT superfamily N-acetyltransferase